MTTAFGKPVAGDDALAMRRVTTIGECMVELAPEQQAGLFRQGFAGDTFNTLWYLKSLRPEWTTRYFTRVGDDAVSSEMVAMMANAGIDTDHIAKDAARSVGLYLISLNQGERSFTYWRNQSAARQLGADRAALERAVEGMDLIYLSGITLGILDDAGRATLLDVLRQARAAGATVAFDSNLRVRLWPSVEAMCAAIMEAAAVSDIVLPSYDDEADFFGDADPQATIDRYLRAGAGSVIVKNGAGSVHYNHSGATGVVIPKVQSVIVDTTSAGDSFNAGFFAELGRSGDVEAAIRLACEVAHQVIARRGALVPLDLDKLSPVESI